MALPSGNAFRVRAGSLHLRVGGGQTGRDRRRGAGTALALVPRGPGGQCRPRTGAPCHVQRTCWTAAAPARGGPDVVTRRQTPPVSSAAVRCDVELLYSPALAAYDHGPSHPLRPERVVLTRELIAAYGLLSEAN